MLALAPGFADEPGKFALAVDLTRITFPYLMLISLVALFGGMLNSDGRFAAYAAAPIFLNRLSRRGGVRGLSSSRTSRPGAPWPGALPLAASSSCFSWLPPCAGRGCCRMSSGRA